MLILVSGGSGSGKSAFAEDLLVSHGTLPRTYIATMQVWDAECEKRVARHRTMRANKGFSTVEVSVKLESLTLDKPTDALLEDLPNLFANEYFGQDHPDTAQDRVLSGVKALAGQCGMTVVVTNELFCDGMTYDLETTAYLEGLATLHVQLATLADGVYEVVAGIPICHKGKGLMLP